MIWYDSIGSTSDTLLAMARQGAPHGTLLAAGSQTAGHGRGGTQRPFFSPCGGLYFSLLLRKHLPPADQLPITPRAALAVRRVMARHSCELGIKWVNDLMKDGRKAGGILTQIAESACVVGIGLNLVQNEPTPESLRDIIAYCYPCAPAQPPVAFAQEIADELLRLCVEDSAVLVKEYRNASAVLGREISYEHNGERLQGRAVDITPTGALLLEGGKVLTSGEVHLRLV